MNANLCLEKGLRKWLPGFVRGGFGALADILYVLVGEVCASAIRNRVT
jgi:hypothetical protein